ncbi:hypothetical protein MBBAR_10c00370 [Methanobrevibacter arboriphilus JCM 13429 = DSM 1125]|uniref:Uncharacterized protein n=1 Tax=Methanobrevibacter arboriphilus JCM 13429 = DSM 1125 TaxID=1300164 RepID=A0A1V6N2G9_METAZ|nr:hypothetical protein [Methanobrevibacter arboriphilus]OQD58696.1 hypothetical protein MBBAR_10c00370 [Methanobrevibacter arboriphilus JCM 13429 = DSM 1125]
MGLKNNKTAIIGISIILLIIIITSALVIINNMDYTPSVSFDESRIGIGNNSSVVIAGDAIGLNEIILYSSDLKLNKTVKVENNRFSERINIPENVSASSIYIKYLNNDIEIDNHIYVLISRLTEDELNDLYDENTTQSSSSGEEITINPVDVHTLTSGEPAYEEGYFAAIQSDDGKVYYIYQSDAMKLGGNFNSPFKAKVSTGSVGANPNANIIEEVMI